MSIADTVNRLISGFRTPDGASSANKVLGEMQFPQISSLLPYRDYDKDSGLFINNKSVGFLLEAQPLIGANEHIVQVMEDLIKSKVPRNTPITFHLMSSQAIGTMIEEGSGTSGAGKTGLVQPILRSVLDAGGIVWVFDMGDGYKSFCENMGGTYLDGRTLKFNPFANISDISESGERIRDQLAVLASPNGTLDEVHEDLLLEAVQAAWDLKHNKARIDDVVEHLKTASQASRENQSERIYGRMDEIVKLLGKYCTWGIYGEYFNSDEPSLRDDARMVVLELGGLQDKPALLAAVMFSLIIYIEDKMYRSPRCQKKCCTIDEGWKLLYFKNEKVGSFIETGYRTVRRHLGSFITISQNIKDFDADDASAAAKAAWGNSAFKVVLKQDTAEFRQYNQKRPDQFTQVQRDIISRFGDAKDQWFSSFMLRINDTSSYHRLFVDPLSRAMFSSKGVDFEFIRARREDGVDIHDAVWELALRNFPDEMQELENWEVAA